LTGLRGFSVFIERRNIMDTLENKKKIELTIECKCVGLDEALEKATRLVELLKVIDEHRDLLD